MKKNILKFFVITFIFSNGIIPKLSFSEATDLKSEFSQIYALYKKGVYAQAIEALTALEKKSNAGINEYWLGLCYARLQNFESSSQHFEKASRLGFQAEDLDYELGQALYATGKIKPAQEAFKRSKEKKYKVGPSLYYIGYIQQSLEDYQGALNSYNEIQKSKEDPDHIKQSALLQVAEIRFTQASGAKDKLRTEIIPIFRKVRDFDATTPIGLQAQRRIQEIYQTISAAIPRFKNGSPISAQPGYLKFSEDFKYDSNVITS